MATPAAANPGPDFDPYTQTITLMTTSDGPIPIAVPDIDSYVNYAVRTCINYGSQIGASLILLLCILLTTKPEKRHSAIFILNALALFFNFIRSTCQCFYFTGQFYEFYSYWADDFSAVPQGQYGASITALVFTLPVVICIEASLVLQVWVILNNATVRRLHRNIVVGACGAIVATAIGFRMALTVENAIYIMAAQDFSEWIWLEEATTYITSASIVIFSFIFVAKLAVALRVRRKTLGMVRWGPMEVVFVMGCQTLIVPALLAILQNVSTVPELGSQMITITALFLPLSSLWAAANIEHSQRATRAKAHRVPAERKPKRALFSNVLARSKHPATDEETGSTPSNVSTIMTATTLSEKKPLDI